MRVDHDEDDMIVLILGVVLCVLNFSACFRCKLRCYISDHLAYVLKSVKSTSVYGEMVETRAERANCADSCRL